MTVDTPAAPPPPVPVGVGVDDGVGLNPRRWAILAVLCLALLMVGIDGTIVNVALPTLVRELGASSTRAAVDRRRLHDRVRQLPAHRREHRRPSRPQTLLRVRPAGVRRRARSAARWSRHRSNAHPAPRRAGLRRRVRHARDAVDPHQRVHRPRRAGPGHRHLGRRVGPRRGHRPARRRLPARPLLVGLDLPRQRADRRVTIVAALRARARLARSARGRLDLVGTAAVDRRSDQPALRHHRGAARAAGAAPIVVASFVVAVVLLTAFVFWERHTDHPMLDVTFFTNPRFTAASIAVTLVFFAMFGSLFFVSQYLQFVLGYTALQSGIRLLPVAITLMIAAPLSARVGRRASAPRGSSRSDCCSSPRRCCSSPASPTRAATALVAAVLVIIGVGHGSGDGAGHRLDHGLAATGEGRRRLGDERHHARDRRRARCRDPRAASPPRSTRPRSPATPPSPSWRPRRPRPRRR